MEDQVILVTGASGYLGTHICHQLLEAGYHVRGTVRDLTNEAKVKAVRDLCPEAKHPIELVEADLTKDESWEPAVKGCSYVVHVASPFPAGVPASADDVIKPAVDGTLSVVKACQKAGVNRLVVTSSVFAIMGTVVQPEAGKTYTEEDWTPESDKITDAYTRSKKDAEKAAWDYIKDLPEEEKFEMAVMNPGLLMGPVLCSTPGTSIEIVKKLLERSMPAVPKMHIHVADVRDVAAAHIAALTAPEAAGHRHILTTQSMWMKEIAQIMAKEFKPQGYNVPTVACPNLVLKAASLFNKAAKAAIPHVGQAISLDNSRMKDVLGITPRDINETVIEMCYSMIENGMAKKSKKFKGPKKEGEEEEVVESADAEKKEPNGDVKPAEETNGDVKAVVEGEVKADDKPAEEKKEEAKEEKKEEVEPVAAAPAEPEPVAAQPEPVVEKVEVKSEPEAEVAAAEEKKEESAEAESAEVKSEEPATAVVEETTTTEEKTETAPTEPAKTD